MDELLAGGGIIVTCLTGLFAIMVILVPLIIFLQYGELKRIRKATEKTDETIRTMDTTIHAMNESIFRIENVDLRKIREFTNPEPVPDPVNAKLDIANRDDDNYPDDID